MAPPSLPKRAERASAACPAGTMGMAAAAAVGGVASGAFGGAASTLSGVKTLPRVAGLGAVRPPEGGAENRPLCAQAAIGIMSANASAHPALDFVFVRLIPQAFSAEIAANSSRGLVRLAAPC